MHRRQLSDTAEANYHESGYILSTTDTLLIGLELMTIFLFLMYAHLTIGNTREAISVIMFGGELSLMFWFWVIAIGLLVPACIELAVIIPRMINHGKYISHRYIDIIVPTTVLIGGFMLRYVVLIAGQITFPIGL